MSFLFRRGEKKPSSIVLWGSKCTAESDFTHNAYARASFIKENITRSIWMEKVNCELEARQLSLEELDSIIFGAIFFFFLKKWLKHVKIKMNVRKVPCLYLLQHKVFLFKGRSQLQHNFLKMFDVTSAQIRKILNFCLELFLLCLWDEWSENPWESQHFPKTEII